MPESCIAKLKPWKTQQRRPVIIFLLGYHLHYKMDQHCVPMYTAWFLKEGHFANCSPNTLWPWVPASSTSSSSELTVCALVSNSPVCKIVNVSSTVFFISAKYCNHTAITGFVVPLPIAVGFGRARKSVGSRNFYMHVHSLMSFIARAFCDRTDT